MNRRDFLKRVGLASLIPFVKLPEIKEEPKAKQLSPKNVRPKDKRELIDVIVTPFTMGASGLVEHKEQSFVSRCSVVQLNFDYKDDSGSIYSRKKNQSIILVNEDNWTRERYLKIEFETQFKTMYTVYVINYSFMLDGTVNYITLIPFQV